MDIEAQLAIFRRQYFWLQKEKLRLRKSGASRQTNHAYRELIARSKQLGRELEKFLKQNASA